MMLITGATGNVGREAMRLLGERAVGLSRTRPLESVDHLEGVLYSPRAATPARLAWAAERGAKRVVVLSAATVSFPVGDPRFVTEFSAAEEAAQHSGLEWTILRSTDYAANALAWVPQLRRGDVVRGAYPGAVTSTVDERDVAAVAVRALLGPELAGQTYLISGPEPLTQSDKVREVGARDRAGAGIRGDRAGAGAGGDAGRRLAAGDPGAVAGITGGLRAGAGTGFDQRG
jgi:uncharacterized protein YbjT (DUF2867 family)